MPTDSNSPPNQPDDSISSATLSEFFWDFINDPAEAQIEEQIRAQIEAQQIGMSNQHRRKSAGTWKETVKLLEFG